ncbi:uncharacterized protein LOC133324163 [Musca vetustissima]|uniref:uncharacterized protein LOC133324163 n=1 Tax=Musca vetustissima TaxID=27455 RepID=UPI002AB7C1D2|nr:uncharacterized protein LOC133324163 [Musca vetustissima]
MSTIRNPIPFLNITISAVPPNCVQMVCKFVCFNGQSSEIDQDIDIVVKKNDQPCDVIEELRLYNYKFTDNRLYHGFLGTYTDKVEALYVASSNVSDVAAGTFAGGIFQKIYFEDLKLRELRKDFFEDISRDFQLLSIIQKENPLRAVNGDFLDYVKYQIKHLTMQVGLSCVRNITGSSNLLNNLIYVDFSYNNFRDHFTDKVFSKVSMVEHIDLSHSNLEYLPPYAFADVVDTLEYLDLSHNKLKTLTHTIFGWHEIPRELKVYAHGNPWECSCDLQREMKEIFIYQTTKLTCSEPESYEHWSLFDDRICEEFETETTKILEVENNDSTLAIEKEEEQGDGERDVVISTTTSTTTTLVAEELPDIINQVPLLPSFPIVVELKCWIPEADKSKENYTNQPLKVPIVQFELVPRDHLSVDVVVEKIEENSDTIGLIWFSKATTQFYKMEINYNEYGLGCYHSITYTNTVTELVPNVAYTFCMIIKDQLMISPFNCKSIHVSGNLSIQSSAWLTRDMKVTGLSLVVFGIVMFSFAGILMIYLLLKRKPILLKGSKRVTTVGSHSDEIVVMPRAKSIKVMKEKENALARKRWVLKIIFYIQKNFTFSLFPHSSKPIVIKRRKSTDSVASYQSYMNTNLYEVIPAYSQITASPTQSRSFDSNTSSSLSSTLTLVNNDANADSQVEMQSSANLHQPKTNDTYDLESCYLTPLNSTVSSSADLVNYAEIPYRTKRVSNDPLPAVPKEQRRLEESANRDIGVIYMLDSQV